MQPTLVTLLICLLIGLFIISLILWVKLEDARNYYLFSIGKQHPYKRRGFFLTPNEKKLYSILNLVPDFKERGIIVVPQVHLSSLLETKDDMKDLQGKFDAIHRLYVDFVLFNSNFEPLLVIELNDRTHLWNNRKARDEFVTMALEQVGIPLLAVKTNDMPNVQLLEEKIFEKIQPGF